MTHVLSRFPSGQTLCVQFHPHLYVDAVGRLHHVSAFPLYSRSTLERMFVKQPQLQSLVWACESSQNIPILNVYQRVLTLAEEEPGMEDTLWGHLIYALVFPTRCGQSFARKTPLTYLETVLLVVLVCAERGLPQRWQHELEDATLRAFWYEATALLHQCAPQPAAEAIVTLTRFFGVPHAIQCVDKTCMAHVALHSNRSFDDERASSAHHPRCYRALQSGVGGRSKASSKRSYAELFDGEQSSSSSSSAAAAAAAAAASSAPSTHNEKRFRSGDADGAETPFVSTPSSFAPLGVSGFSAAAAASDASSSTSSSASVSNDASSHAHNQSQLFDFSAYAWLNPSTAGSVAVPLEFDTAGQNNEAASLDASLTDEHLNELDDLAETWSSHVNDNEDDEDDRDEDNGDDDDGDDNEESKHETPLRGAPVQHPGRHSGQSINTDFLRNMVRDALHNQGIYSDNGTAYDSSHHHQDRNGNESVHDLSSVVYQAGKPTWHAPPPRRNVHAVDIQPAHPALLKMAPMPSSKAAIRKTPLRMVQPLRSKNTALSFLFQWHIQLMCQLLWIESVRHNGDSNARVTLCQMLHDCVALFAATDEAHANECITVEPLVDPRFHAIGAFFFPRAFSLKLYPIGINFCPPIVTALTGYPPLKHLITSAEPLAIRLDTASHANVVTNKSASPLAAWNITEVDFRVFWEPLLANPQYEIHSKFLRPFSRRPNRHRQADSEKYVWHHYYSTLSDAQILESKDRFFPGQSLSELKRLFTKHVPKRLRKSRAVVVFPKSIPIDPPVTLLRPLTFEEYWLCSRELRSLKTTVVSVEMTELEHKMQRAKQNKPWAYIHSVYLPHWNRKLLLKAWSNTLLPGYLAPVPTQLMVASPNVPSTKFISPALFPNELNRPPLQPFVFPPHVDQNTRAQSIRKVDADLLLSIPISYHDRWHAQFRCGISPHVILVYTFVLLATNTRVCYVHRSNLSALLDDSLSRSSYAPLQKVPDSAHTPGMNVTSAAAPVPTTPAHAVPVHMAKTTALDANVMRIDRNKIRDTLGEVSRRGASIDFFRTINTFPFHSFTSDVWIFLRNVLLPYLEYQEDMSHSHEEARNLSLVVGNAWR
jgi:hypothetical protein